MLLLLFIALILQEKIFNDLTSKAFAAAIVETNATSSTDGATATMEPIAASLRAAEKALATPEVARAALLQAASKINQHKGDGTRAGHEALTKLNMEVLALISQKSGTAFDPVKLRTLVTTAEAMAANSGASAPSVEWLKARQELVKSYMEATAQSREFWKGMAQMILLNLLLPVLTGLLGYVFASRQANKP